MAEEKKIATGYIGNALRSAADNHTTTFADEIFDTERQKYQNEVNTDLEATDNEIKADLESEKARAKAAEEANATAIAEEKAAIMGTDRISDGAVTTEKLADSAISQAMTDVVNKESERAYSAELKKVNIDNTSEAEIKDESEKYEILDKDGNIGFSFDKNGVKAKKYLICGENGNVQETLDEEFFKKTKQNDLLLSQAITDETARAKAAEEANATSIQQESERAYSAELKKVNIDNTSEAEIKDESEKYEILDKDGNIGFSFDKNGVKAKKYLICGENGNVQETLDEEFFKKTKIRYNKGIQCAFGNLIECSDGSQVSINYQFSKHGEYSIKADIINSGEENYIILPLETPSHTNIPLGFWLWIDFFSQYNIDNLKVQITNDSGNVQAQVYSFGNKMYDSSNTYLGEKIPNTIGGWIYINVIGKTGTKLKLIFKSESILSGEQIATIYIDSIYYIGKSITPTFVINGDGFYNNDAALEIYKYIEDKGLVHSICGTFSESETMPELMKKQIKNGTLELGAYGGQDGEVIARGTNYDAMITSCRKIISKTSQESELRIPPKLYGCQFHKLTPLINRVVTDCGFKIIKGGGFGWVNCNFQQIYDHDKSMPLIIMPTGFTGVSNGIDFLKDKAKNWIDKVISIGTIGVVFNHNYSIDPSTESSSNLYTYVDVMKFIIDYISELKTSEKCLVMKPTDLYENLITI